MKLTVGDISFSESGYALATVKVETGTFPFLLFSACKMVVPVVDGKEINDYKEDLKNKARKTITKMYKEIVCGGNDIGEQSTMLIQAANSSSIQMMQASIDELKEQITRLKEEKHSKNEAIKPFEIKDGGIIINAPQMTLTHHQMSKDGLEKFIAALAEQTELNQELDDSLVVRDADGSVRVRMNAEKQADSAISIEVGFPKMESTIDKMELKNKPDGGEERDFYGLNISYKKTLNSDIVIRGLVDTEKNTEEPTIHLLYSEDYNEQSSFSDFYSRAEKYARDAYRKIKASD
ncbi:hypothetical protein CSN22_004387 [Salmonella enterica subsp. diarizonae]|nr:hypothetical protein [Salmonella enterica subsp. diarizonae]